MQARGINGTVVVDHPDWAWRCHEDCGWGAYSKWRSIVCDVTPSVDGCRMDNTHNLPYASCATPFVVQLGESFGVVCCIAATHAGTGATVVSL